MAHVETHRASEAHTAPRSNLLYGLNDKPPIKEALFVAMQHVCAIFIPVVTPGLLITGALGLDPAPASYILGMSLFVSGVGTFIQVNRLGPIGSGLLAVQGTSFAFVTPILAVVTNSLAAGKTPEATLSLILGMCFFGSFIPIILSRFLHLTRKIFTPLVTGTAVTLIGLCLIKVGMFYMAGGGKAQAIAAKNPESPQAFGSLQNWGLAVLVFAIVGVCSASSNRYLRMSSVIIGLFVGFGLIWATFVIWEYYNNDRAMLQRAVIARHTVWMPAVFIFFFAAAYFVFLYYLPIYFQSILGASPIRSGVNNLPLVLAAAVFALVGGAVVTVTGRAQQVMFSGALVTTVAMGLIYTLDLDTSRAK